MKSLDVDFVEELVPFVDGSNRERFRAFSPTGLVPCLHDDAVVVWESLAIVEYLAERHAGVWPTDPLARNWARCAAAEMHAGFSALRNECPMSCGIRIVLFEVSSALRIDVQRLTELWCEGLQRFGGPFLAGSQASAVDAFFAPVVYRWQSYGLSALGEGRSGQQVENYVRHMLETSPMQKWYQSALAETYREALHEEEFRELGVIQHDYRAKAE